MRSGSGLKCGLCFKTPVHLSLSLSIRRNPSLPLSLPIEDKNQDGLPFLPQCRSKKRKRFAEGPKLLDAGGYRGDLTKGEILRFLFGDAQVLGALSRFSSSVAIRPIHGGGILGKSIKAKRHITRNCYLLLLEVATCWNYFLIQIL
ncbi:hypothetical protein I3842_12G039600 [Carya illinoinensis]|uniref:Uncharacterized protein n=1 Tax=Carya illinoinensis TaxID=32201 RepID=A0A922IV05_CARIL|nr:hypothetical protein I3842_12G039600 [Carya illinoinensis]